jgi:hypothetical protein
VSDMDLAQVRTAGERVKGLADRALNPAQNRSFGSWSLGVDFLLARAALGPGAMSGRR